MYDLKKIQTTASGSVSTLPPVRPLKKVGDRALPAVNARNPRMMIGLVFLFLLLAYLVAYAQEYAPPSQPYLIIQRPDTQVAAPGSIFMAQTDQPMPIPQTGR